MLLDSYAGHVDTRAAFIKILLFNSTQKGGWCRALRVEHNKKNHQHSILKENKPKGENEREREAKLRCLYAPLAKNGLLPNVLFVSFFFAAVLMQVATDVGKMYIRGVASHLYFCINKCGILYGSVSYFIPFCFYNFIIRLIYCSCVAPS